MRRAPLILSHLKFRHFRLIDLLCRYGTLHRAAGELNISQPAATGMLNTLEGLIGFPLFVRSTVGLSPTEACLTLLGRLHTILNEFDYFALEVNAVLEGDRTVLRVSIVPQAFMAYLPRAIEVFRAAGGCPIRAEEGTADQLLEKLLAGKLDCVVGRLPGQGAHLTRIMEELVFVDLYDEDVSIVAKLDNPIARLPIRSLEQLADYEWVLQRPDSSVRAALVEAFLRQGLRPPTPAVETASYVQNLGIVSGTDLLTVVPTRIARIQAERGLVKILEIPLGVSPMRVCMISRKSSRDDCWIRLFTEGFVNVCHAAEGGPPH